MIRLSRYADPATVIGEPRPEKRANAEARAAGIEAMRTDLPRIMQQLRGHGAKPAWFVDRYQCWARDAHALLAELGAKKSKLGEYKL
jgi:hypothetical protein